MKLGTIHSLCRYDRASEIREKPFQLGRFFSGALLAKVPDQGFNSFQREKRLRSLQAPARPLQYDPLGMYWLEPGLPQ
jgi:hypothetical protein